jgi:hypothetical protein
MRFGKEKLDEVIRRNIEHGHTEVAIKVFVKYVKSLNEDDSGLGKKIYMDVIQISSRFYSLSRQNQNGLLSNNEYIEQLNRINYAILSILDELPKRTL